MPLPTGAHPLHDAPVREQWRADNAELVERLADYVGADGFLLDMQDNIRYYGWLTPNQQRVAQRLLNMIRAGLIAEVATPTAEAGTNDVTSIFNGEYTLNDGTEHLTYRIHTVLSGPLTGKRIVKRLMGGGIYRGFAFLTMSGHLKVWRRFTDDDNRNERYIVWARLLLDILRDEGNETTTSYGSGGVTYQVQRSLRCRACNRALTNPSSIDAGLGPECAARATDRTTAARAHEAISEPTLTRLAESSVAEQAADQVLSVTINPDTPEEQSLAALRTFIEVNPRLDDNDSITVPSGGGHVIESMIERQARLEREFTARLVGMTDVEEVLRLAARYGVSADAGHRRRMFELAMTRARNLSWYRMRTVCTYCGRHDFTSERGCTSHERNYCPVHRAQEGQRRQEAAQRNAARSEAARQARMAAGPNLSQLGTVVGGSVWPQ